MTNARLQKVSHCIAFSHRDTIGPLAKALYALATIQVVWAYHSRVSPYLHLLKYENGLEVTPCQTRILMALVLRWAHHCRLLISLAALFSNATPIYRSKVYPESFIFAIADTIGIVVAGWVATRIYEAASERRLLTPYIYPLVLVFCGAQYVLVALHPFRFYYDLPSLGFFAVGLYLIYFRKHPLLFAALFVVATLNRETTLLLLLFYLLAAVSREGIAGYRRAYAGRALAIVAPLAIFWVGWHIYIDRLFAQNLGAPIPASKINTVLLLWPPAWPQMLATGCYCVIPIIAYRKYVRNRTLRLWLWTLPAWFAIMFRYAIIDEPRLFGELIPYLACMAAIVMEEAIILRLRNGWGGHNTTSLFRASTVDRALPVESRDVLLTSKP
jgi:hypothetical protein